MKEWNKPELSSLGIEQTKSEDEGYSSTGVAFDDDVCPYEGEISLEGKGKWCKKCPRLSCKRRKADYIK